MSKERLKEIETELQEIRALIKKGNQEDNEKISEKIIDLYLSNHVDFIFNQVKQELDLVEAHELKDLENKGLVEQLKTLQSDFLEIKRVAEMHRSNELKLEQQNKRYREAYMVLEQIYKDNFVRNSYGYEDGYLDGIDTAINVIDEALEDEE